MTCHFRQTEIYAALADMLPQRTSLRVFLLGKGKGKATVRTGHGTTDRFQITKGVRQGCILSPCLFNFYAENIMRNAGLEET